MREEPESMQKQADRKYLVALGLYVVLAGISWFLLGSDSVWINDRLIEVRWVPLFVMGLMAIKTVLAHHADKIRRSSENKGR